MEGTNKTEVTATAGYECAVDLGLVYLGHWAVELNHYLLNHTCQTYCAYVGGDKYSSALMPGKIKFRRTKFTVTYNETNHL